MNEDTPQGIFEELISGPSTGKLIDFFVTYKDFDYSETDIAALANVSPKTAAKEIDKFEKLGIIKFTRNVGKAKMYRLDTNSEIGRAWEELAFLLAKKDIANIDPLQQKLPAAVPNVQTEEYLSNPSERGS